ncbi:tryptophan-rich antigen [Plasmodium gonderi]|uniref:Tryptophan-rich antigen n=1 Tax=Plasmodium gonderi TaxID=77519 RepID=A0A1Y1JGM4_PLAGO|nr:tryptophan-rich antigen [Plasmodium gonderi]GAW79593.1 tryptophan-rich antigen [Plasmodium gonderi]
MYFWNNINVTLVVLLSFLLIVRFSVFINNLLSKSLTKLSSHRCVRNLSDFSLLSSLTENFLYNDDGNRDFSYNKCSLGSDRPAKSRDHKGITRNDAIKLINSCGIFVVKKKKIHYALHVFNEYLKSLYLDMMNELWIMYKKIATEYGMPKKEQMIHWKICETELLINLLEIEEYSQKDLYAFTKSSVIFSLSVDIFRLLHESYWLTKIKMFKSKWSKYLISQAKKYKSVLEDGTCSEVDAWLKDHACSEDNE